MAVAVLLPVLSAQRLKLSLARAQQQLQRLWLSPELDHLNSHGCNCGAVLLSLPAVLHSCLPAAAWAVLMLTPLLAQPLLPRRELQPGRRLSACAELAARFRSHLPEDNSSSGA